MVVVQNVSKRYKLYSKASDRLLEALPFGPGKRHKDFWALQNVSFTVAPGEVLGLVGPNGSGKSTVLQIAAGILQPTQGRVSVEGRVAALLELGAGFNPDFSGRENVYLNSEILGISKPETDRIFPEIAAFAEIGDFMDRPVKEYSSGMYVRLAFATAIHVNPDVLIVDEALAVGDAIFANRCLRKLEQLREKKVTILFVSHDLGLVKRICHRAVLMYQGEILCEGDPAQIVNQYVGIVHDRGRVEQIRADAAGGTRHGDATAKILEAQLLNEDGLESATFRKGENITVEIRVEFHSPTMNPMIGILIRNRLGIDVFGTNTKLERIELGTFHAGEGLRIQFTFPCAFTRQEYTVTVASQHEDGSSQDWIDDFLPFVVVDEHGTAGLTHLPTKIDFERREHA